MNDDVSPQPAPPPAGAFRTFFASTTNQILTAVVAVIVGAVGTMLSPVVHHVEQKVYPEKIGIGQTVQADENQAAVFKVALTDLSGGVGISGGRITLTPADDSITLTGPQSFTFASTPGSTDVAPPEGLTVQTRTLGESQIAVDLLTNKGKHFKGTITVRSVAARPATSAADLSGHWRFMLNRKEGDFDLDEAKYRFTVTGKFDDGSPITGSGWRDGTTFRLTLGDKDGKSYSTEGIYCQVKMDQSIFVVVNSRVTVLDKGERIKAEVPLKAILQRCPDYPSLKDYDGDGVFMATVPLG